jgi:sarcosine oxidase, subunit alpha
LKAITVRDRAGVSKTISCNGLAVSGGFTPLIHLASHPGVKPVYDEQRSMFLGGTLPHTWRAGGAFDLKTALAEGYEAARTIGAIAGVSVPSASAEVVEALSFGSVTPLRWPKYGSSSKIWVDLQNDVKVSDVDLAARESYVSVEHLKRYATLGMGTDQGRTSNVNGLALMAGLTGQPVDALGTTTFRPPRGCANGHNSQRRQRKGRGRRVLARAQ